ncbi:hypothetical protein ACFE04_020554 [Oxalis oulophora]
MATTFVMKNGEDTNRRNVTRLPPKRGQTEHGAAVGHNLLPLLVKLRWTEKERRSPLLPLLEFLLGRLAQLDPSCRAKLLQSLKCEKCLEFSKEDSSNNSCSDLLSSPPRKSQKLTLVRYLMNLIESEVFSLILYIVRKSNGSYLVRKSPNRNVERPAKSEVSKLQDIVAGSINSLCGFKSR